MCGHVLVHIWFTWRRSRATYRQITWLLSRRVSPVVRIRWSLDPVVTSADRSGTLTFGCDWLAIKCDKVRKRQKVQHSYVCIQLVSESNFRNHLYFKSPVWLYLVMVPVWSRHIRLQHRGPVRATGPTLITGWRDFVAGCWLN